MYPVRFGAHGRTVDTKTSAIPLDASAQEFSRKGISICGVYELEHAEGSCNDKRGIFLYSSWRYLVTVTLMESSGFHSLLAVKR